MRGLTTKRHKDGYDHFYWNGYDITGFWMSFFAGLNIKEERYCEWLFWKRHGKEFNKKYPLDKA